MTDEVMTDEDEEALEAAWQILRARDPETARTGTDDDKEYAVYSLQCKNLNLKPWQLPPRSLYGCSKEEVKACDKQSYKILQRMERAKISIFHPDPLAALAAMRGPT